MREISAIVVHCSASPWGDVEAIREWHTLPPPKGRGWLDIGYHYVVGNGFRTWPQFKNHQPEPSADGAVWLGRDLDHDGDVEEERGAHCVEVNGTSIGVCLVGPRFTARQQIAAARLVAGLCARYGLGVEAVMAHHEYPSGAHKECPVLDMNSFRRSVAAAITPPATA